MNRSTLLTSIHRLQLRKETLLQELESLDLHLRSQQAQYSRLVNEDAAVYRLPNELLTNIFMMCTKTSTTAWPARTLPFQVVASHVSHRWRDIALGTPLLWNTFSAIMKHLSGSMISQMEEHLERSNSCFLDIALDFQVSRDLAVYCQLLAKHSRRWRRLSILTTFVEITEIREMLDGVEVPMLEHLSLVLGRQQTSSLSPRQQFASVTPVILTTHSPCLTFVRLAGQALGNLHPPTSSVTTLHLDGWTRHYMSHDQFKAVLEGAPLLINLSLNQLYFNLPRDPFDIAKPTTLPFLRALRIRGPCSPLSRLMPLLRMPQLEAITLDGLEAFDSQVMPTVRSLTLEVCSFDEQDFGKLSRCLPSLSDLSMDQPEIFVSIETGSRQLPWPQLQTITVRDLESLDVPAFYNMVLHRQAVDPNQGGSNPLRRILLDRRSRTVLRAKQRLEGLQAKLIVENADILPAPWPMGLPYEDAHDLLE